MRLNIDLERLKTLVLCFIAAYGLTLIPMDVLAAAGDSASSGDATSGTDPISTVLCNVVSVIEGPIGSGIATLAIIVIGVGALMGKVSWGMAIIVGIGIGVIFGAPKIVGQISGNSGAGCDG